MEKFRQLKADHGKHPDRMCDNNRPIQPLKGRTVYSVKQVQNNNNNNNNKNNNNNNNNNNPP